MLHQAVLDEADPPADPVCLVPALVAELQDRLDLMADLCELKANVQHAEARQGAEASLARGWRHRGRGHDERGAHVNGAGHY